MRHISLTKIADNLSDKQHQETFTQISEQGIDGIEISGFGGRWGPTWDENKNYNLNFLKFYKGIKALRIQLSSTIDLNPIIQLADSLECIHIGERSNKKTGFSFLEQLRNLKSISTVRHINGLNGITTLRDLKELYLTGYSVDKMDFLNELKTLKRLYIGFGTSDHIDTINRLDNLEELDILWIKKLSNIDAISNLLKIQKLKIQDEKQIVALPDFSNLKNFKNIRLMNLGSLGDISSLTNSYIEEFIWTGPNKNSEILNSIKNSKNPKKVYSFFYTKKEQKKAERILIDKFCSLDKMKYEMVNAASEQYYNLTTGQKIL